MTAFVAWRSRRKKVDKSHMACEAMIIGTCWRVTSKAGACDNDAIRTMECHTIGLNAARSYV